jgi:hypothetical protein
MSKCFIGCATICLLLFAGCGNRGAGALDKSLDSLARLKFGPAYDIEMQGDVACLSHNQGVEIVKVADPRRPVRLGRIPLPDGAFDLEWQGGLLYIAADEEGFCLADIKDPSHPRVLSRFRNHEGSVVKLAVKGESVFVGSFDGRVTMLDARDPSRLREVADLAVGKGISAMALVGDCLYVGTYDGLKVIATGDASGLKIIGSLQDIFAQDLDLQETYLYVSGHKNGLRVLDVSAPRQPLPVGSFNDGGEANSSYVSGQTLYVSDADSSIIEVMDIRDPRKPEKVREYMGCRPHAVIVRDKILYIATTAKGLHVLKMR